MASIQTYTGARAKNNGKIEADEGVDNKSGVERPEMCATSVGNEHSSYHFFFLKNLF